MQHRAFGTALAVLAVAALGACTRSADAPTAEPAPGTAAVTTQAAPETTTETTTETTGEDTHTLPAYGVVETTKQAVGAGETTCEPDTPPANPVEVRAPPPPATSP